MNPDQIRFGSVRVLLEKYSSITAFFITVVKVKDYLSMSKNQSFGRKNKQNLREKLIYVTSKLRSHSYTNLTS